MEMVYTGLYTAASMLAKQWYISHKYTLLFSQKQVLTTSVEPLLLYIRLLIASYLVKLSANGGLMWPGTL